MDNIEDPRVRKGICGHTIISASGIEWICVKEPHGEVYNRKVSSRNHRRGDPIFSNNPKVDQHYVVNRWPYREKING